MENIEILATVGIVILIVIAKMIYDKLSVKRRMRSYLKKIYGSVPEADYDLQRYEYIDFYLKHKTHPGDIVDQITWNDFEMEDIFKLLNQTSTGIGEEYLYAALHEPQYDKKVLGRRDEWARWFDEHEDQRIEVQTALCRLGKMRNMGVYQYCQYLKDAPGHNPVLNIFLCAGLIFSIVMSFVRPMPFVGLLLCFVAVNMIVYFTYKNRSYFDNFSYVSGITYCAQSIVRQDIPVMKEEMAKIRKMLVPFKRMSRYGWLFQSGSKVGGTLLDLLMDYIKMLFHIDLILFDFVLGSVHRNEAALTEIMDFIGEIDLSIAIASYRRLMAEGWCQPQLEQENSSRRTLIYEAKAMYHPLIIEPVKNDISTSGSVLLTGSNASGKSTFLKTVAINAILAQTIFTAMADSYRANYFRIYSSMALRDNLSGGESYFIVEIKSLKRIVSQADGEIPMLCFIDEVLRGTNTIERIAASSQILKQLSLMNAVCFAATHDIELTSMLEDYFDNYHFQEEVKEKQVVFDYKLHQGRAVSRNAIKLLGMIGFDQTLIDKAQQSASRFEQNGQWRL